MFDLRDLLMFLMAINPKSTKSCLASTGTSNNQGMYATPTGTPAEPDLEMMDFHRFSKSV